VVSGKSSVAKAVRSLMTRGQKPELPPAALDNQYR